VSRLPLLISRDPDLDWLHALAFGAVNDGLPDEPLPSGHRAVSSSSSAPGGRPIGFDVAGFKEFDPFDPAHDEIWSSPRFDGAGRRRLGRGGVALADVPEVETRWRTTAWATRCTARSPSPGLPPPALYAELVPEKAWAWCWLGKACEALGDPAEAAQAYERAIALEDAGSFQTDAPQLLAEMVRQR
jgi:hypothetical protein